MNPRILLSTALLTASIITAGTATAQLASPDRIQDDPSRELDSRELARCSTPNPTHSEMEQVAAELKARERQLGTFAVGGQIKVAWHVIYNGSTGNIPQSQIDASILELNRAYAGYYGGVNTGYTFVLASVDRTNNRQWFTMTPNSSKETNAKNALAIDPARRLNVYTCAPGQGLLGWAVFPWSYAESNKKHGVVIHYGSVPGGYLAPFNLGGTLVHEVGHYLGLYHTFQGGCTGSGDYVADTPAQGTATSGCPLNKDTCTSPGLDPIHNYMDYSDDACYTELTAGQDARMDQMVPQYRPSLLNAAVAQAVAAPPAAEAAAPVLRESGLGLAVAPSPFTRETRLSFVLPRTAHTSLRIYNVAGQLVETLADGEWEAGAHSLAFRPRNLPAGMYFARLVSGGESTVRSVVLIH